MSFGIDLLSCKILPETIMKRRTLAPDRAALAEEIASLSKAGIANLRERWKNLYGKQPPRRSRQVFSG